MFPTASPSSKAVISSSSISSSTSSLLIEPSIASHSFHPYCTPIVNSAKQQEQKLSCLDGYLYMHLFSFIDDQEYTQTVMSFAKTCKSFYEFVCQQGLMWEKCALAFGPTKPSGYLFHHHHHHHHHHLLVSIHQNNNNNYNDTTSSHPSSIILSPDSIQTLTRNKDLLIQALKLYHWILNNSAGRELKAFRLQNMDLCLHSFHVKSMDDDHLDNNKYMIDRKQSPQLQHLPSNDFIMLSMFSTLPSLELSNISISWKDLHLLLHNSTHLKRLVIHHLKIENVTLVASITTLFNLTDNENTMRRMAPPSTRTETGGIIVSGVDDDDNYSHRVIHLPFLIHLEIAEQEHDLFLKLTCPNLQSLKLKSEWRDASGRDNPRSVSIPNLFFDERKWPFRHLRHVSLKNCHSEVATGIVACCGGQLESLELFNTMLVVNNNHNNSDDDDADGEAKLKSIQRIGLGSFDGLSFKQIFDLIVKLTSSVDQLDIHESFLKNSSSNREDSKPYSIQNLENVRLVVPDGASKLNVNRVVIHCTRIPDVLRKCMEKELRQLVTWNRLEYHGRGKMTQYPCADPALIEIIDREIYKKKSLVVVTPELHQALILCTGYCKSRIGNTRKRLQELWNYLLRHNFDPIGIREFGLGKLLQKTRHIRELHAAMTNFGTSSEVVQEFEEAYSNVQQVLKFHKFQDPGPTFSQLIKQVESCAFVMKRDIERVNVGSLEVLLNRDEWVNESVVEDYSQNDMIIDGSEEDQDVEFLDVSVEEDNLSAVTRK